MSEKKEIVNRSKTCKDETKTERKLYFAKSSAKLEVQKNFYVLKVQNNAPFRSVFL